METPVVTSLRLEIIDEKINSISEICKWGMIGRQAPYPSLEQYQNAFFEIYKYINELHGHIKQTEFRADGKN
jgi:hypothetical protein